ncbi:SDR family oxidoreductase [Alkalicoccus chagannorensis]|uniref:SDR family oxidoreductase n=1 Tax=Alkalicoccus chagannorensis TaxID=427072 RepID=UPI0003FB6203|nr:SDR family oxidoreductase [Alkalicoccus chagannorensis]
MKVLVIGANGQIGSHMVTMLGLSRDHQVRAMVRKEEQKDKMNDLHAEEVVLGDLEQDFSHALEGVDAVIFTAGSGGHTGKEQTEIIDRNAAIRAVEQAEKAGVQRFIMISTMMADKPNEAPEKAQHYFQAKHDADEALINSSLNYTIFRPGPLSNDEAQGTVTIQKKMDSFDGSIAREDVANAAVNALVLEETYHQILEIHHGSTPVGEALKTFS